MLKVSPYRFSECQPVWLMDSLLYYIEYCPLPEVYFNVELILLVIVGCLYLLRYRKHKKYKSHF